jgi:hypothetical protein
MLCWHLPFIRKVAKWPALWEKQRGDAGALVVLYTTSVP